MANPFDKQIKNRNFLSPLGFKFNLVRTPKVDFFANSANIPGINLGVAVQTNYLRDLPIPGDKLTYEDFNLRFMVDENLENYLEVHNWMRGLGYPESIAEYDKWRLSDPYNPQLDPNVSDGTLTIYNSNYQPVATVKFRGLFPTYLSTIEFDSTDTEVRYVTADATFKYALYDIIPNES